MSDDATTPLFDNGAGGSLSLTVCGYQFPEITQDLYDSNWLMISGKAMLDGRAWSFDDPCLLTFELEALADWLDELAQGHARRDLSFVEPNLTFTHDGNGVLRIRFRMEVRPPWRTDEAYLAVRPTPDQLWSAALRLRAMLSAYPQRARDFRAPGT